MVCSTVDSTPVSLTVDTAGLFVDVHRIDLLEFAIDCSEVVPIDFFVVVEYVAVNTVDSLVRFLSAVILVMVDAVTFSVPIEVTDANTVKFVSGVDVDTFREEVFNEAGACEKAPVPFSELIVSIDIDAATVVL